MRIGFLGPSHDLAELESAAEFLLARERAPRIIYLGSNGALDRCVSNWAVRLVGDDPTDENAWRRAADVALDGTPDQIDSYVEGERKRLALRALMSLPEQASLTVEMIGDRVTVITCDKNALDEEDIFAASLVVFGDGDIPLVKTIGIRTFLTPGPLGLHGGIMVLEEVEAATPSAVGTIGVTIYNSAERPIHHELLGAPRTTRMRILSEP